MRRAVAVAFALGACGRVNFDPLGGGGGGTGDGSTVDVRFGDAPMATSCVSLPATCGPMGPSDCCTPLPVPGGTFYRGYDVGSDGAFPMMNAPATVSSFWLDHYEVTVGRFRRFVDAGYGTQLMAPMINQGARRLNGVEGQGGWQAVWNANLAAGSAAFRTLLACDPLQASWTDAPAANESLPINCVTWYDAFAFCVWDGGWLPTEAELHYASSGGAEQRAYPWSNPASDVTVDCVHANYFHSPDFCTADAQSGAPDRVGARSPAGDGRWGHADLAGNVKEWVLDWSGPYSTPCDDCANLTSGTNKPSRGGYFGNALTNLRAAQPSNFSPTERQEFHGVRCARSLGS